MKKSKLFIACDTTDLTKVKKIIAQSQTKKNKNWLQIWIRIYEL